MFARVEINHETVPFLPGQSGNPGGRPPVAREFRERCRDFMESRGWNKLERMAGGKGPFAYQAMQLIAAYAYGKPTQPVSRDPTAPPVRVTVTFDDASSRPE